MDKEYITGRDLAEKMMVEDKEKALRMRKTLIMARIAQRMEDVDHENDFWLKEGFLDGIRELAQL